MTVFTGWAVITISFGLIHQLPGGPIQYLQIQLAQQGREAEYLNDLSDLYLGFRPDDPLYVQYYDYVIGVLQGDLGTSVLYGDPVIEVLLRAAPWTLFVLGIALLMNYMIGLSLGAFMAYTEGSKFDIGGTILSVFLSSVPYYVFALILLFVLGFQWEWFPTGGRFGNDVEPGYSLSFLHSAVYHAALPIISLVFTSFASLGMRANSISVLGSDYLRAAELRGLRTRRIVIRYVLHNAVLPMYTGFMIALGSLFGGSVILEQIFNYRGMGYYLLQGYFRHDYPLMMGGFVFITGGVLTGLFIADLTYSKLDPRVGGVNDESY